MNGEDGSFPIAKTSPFSIEKFLNDNTTFNRSISAVVQRRERNLCASAGVHGVQVVDDGFHCLKSVFLSPTKSIVKNLLCHFVTWEGFVRVLGKHFIDNALSNTYNSLQRMFFHLSFQSVFDFTDEAGVITLRFHNLDHVLDEALGYTRCHVVVELRAGLTAVHIILCILNGDTGKGGIGADVLRLTQIAMTSIETALKEFGEVMLATGHGERIEIHVVNVDVAVSVSFGKPSRNHLLKTELLGGFCAILQHSTHAGVSVNVAVFALVVRTDRINKSKFVELLAQVRMDFTLASTFISVKNIRLCHVSKILGYQFFFNQILNLFNRHLLGELRLDFQNDFIQHIPFKMNFHSLGGFPYGMEEFTPVMLNDSAVTFDDLSHSYSYL